MLSGGRRIYDEWPTYLELNTGVPETGPLDEIGPNDLENLPKEGGADVEGERISSFENLCLLICLIREGG